MKAKLPHDRSLDPLKDATLVALESVIDPLIGLMLDVGITAHEFSKLIRERAVRIATSRVQSQTGRTSHSRVSIATGLPRSEVAKILKPAATRGQPKRSPNAARRILDAWYQSPTFLLASGEPAAIPIFGRRRSLEYLVAKYGAGIPVRAMLDELIQIDAIEHVADQKVKAKSRIPIMRGPSPGAIIAMGDRTRELLETLTLNLRNRSQPLFEATAFSDETDPALLAVIKREIDAQGSNFIKGIDALLHRSSTRARPSNSSRGISQKSCRAGVTAYYFQAPSDNIDSERASLASRLLRKNFQRIKKSSREKADDNI